MENIPWLNLSEAADLAGCSRKTLYRYMEKKRLAYSKEENNRRYVQQCDIEKLFPRHQHQQHKGQRLRADLTELFSLLERLSTEIETQSNLLERMVALYQPKTLAELVTKREKLSVDLYDRQTSFETRS
jgi:DNA-binding transcriptional MerR regulator